MKGDLRAVFESILLYTILIYLLAKGWKLGSFLVHGMESSNLGLKMSIGDEFSASHLGVTLLDRDGQLFGPAGHIGSFGQVIGSLPTTSHCNSSPNLPMWAGSVGGLRQQLQPPAEPSSPRRGSPDALIPTGKLPPPSVADAALLLPCGPGASVSCRTIL